MEELKSKLLADIKEKLDQIDLKDYDGAVAYIISLNTMDSCGFDYDITIKFNGDVFLA